MAIRIDWSALDAVTPRVVCAWCQHVISDGCGPVSHGICASCFEGALRSISTAARRCTRCHQTHTTNVERARCSRQEDR